MTRGTIIWFVGSAVVGAAAGGLHLLRSELGGAHTGVPLAIGAFGLTALAAAMLFHGVVRAGQEQDAAAGPPSAVDDEADAAGVRGPREAPGEPVEPVEPPAVYTFRAGKPVDDRSRRPAKRDRSSRG
jgi:hypothetical protein